MTPHQKPPEEQTDLELVRQVKDGRLDAFDELARRVRRDIFLALWFNHIRDQDDIEELAQRTLIRAYEKLSMFRDEGSFNWWVKSIARNIAIDHLRARAKERQRFAVVEMDGMRSSIRPPDRDLESRARRQRLEEALDRENPAAVEDLLEHVGGESYKEIADRRGKTEGAVKMAVKRLRDRLRGVME
jgi:RNA polymerase sigma-70 factor (ECF subfamily)